MVIARGLARIGNGVYALSDPAMVPAVLAQLAVLAESVDAVLGELLANLHVDALANGLLIPAIMAFTAVE